MNLTMSRAEFDALPDRATLQFDPVLDHHYRDPAWPTDVFQCWQDRPTRWACFHVDIAPPANAPV